MVVVSFTSGIFKIDTTFFLTTVDPCKLEVISNNCCKGEIKFIEAVIMAMSVVRDKVVEGRSNKPVNKGPINPNPFKGPVQNMTKL